MSRKNKKSAQLSTYFRTRYANLEGGFGDESFPRINKPLSFRTVAKSVDSEYLLKALGEEADIARLRNKYSSFDTHCRVLERNREYVDKIGMARAVVYHTLSKANQ